jgi:glutamate 5-kinase
MTDVIGDFKRGDTVEIASTENSVIARGLVNFSAAECRKIAGMNSDGLHKILGNDTEDEVIHRNNLTLMD